MISKDRVQFLRDYIQAGIPFIFLKVPSEKFFTSEFSYYLDNSFLREYDIFDWDFAEGLKYLSYKSGDKGFIKIRQGYGLEQEELITPEGILTWVDRKVDVALSKATTKSFVLFIHNFHLFFSNPRVIQFLKNIKEKFLFLDRPPALVLITNGGKLVPELENDFTFIDMTFFYKQREAIKEFLTGFLEEKGKVFSQEKIDQIVENSMGLDMFECEKIYSILYRKYKDIPPEYVLKEKIKVINQYSFLEYIRHNITEDKVGGLRNFKNWIKKRAILFKEKPEGFLPPKGVLMLGVPGTGKSLSAKYVSHVFGVPLIRVNFGSLFGMYVGQTESNLNKMISVVESIGSCVLWFDEMEKSLAAKSQSGDSGVSKRVLSRLLTWMQEKDRPIFIFATANNVEELPPEFIRKGRFDEIFFVDLPDEYERYEIFRVYLKDTLKDADIRHLAKISDGFVGADIQYVVEEAKLTAYQEGIPISANLIENILKQVPRSIDNPDINHIRQMCLGRFRPAS